MFKEIASGFVTMLGKVQWNWLLERTKGRYFDITAEEQETIREHLKHNYYIILTRRKSHLSTYAINLSHWYLTRRWGYYSHTLMNAEDAVQTDDDFRLMEATNATGVSYTPFENVFNCDSVALLKPKNMSLTEWTMALENLKTHEGKTYDTVYDLKDQTQMSCVELVRTALRANPEYDTDFANFEKLVATTKNLDPQMFYECGDFEVVYEVRH